MRWNAVNYFFHSIHRIHRFFFTKTHRIQRISYKNSPKNLDPGSQCSDQ